MLHAIVKFKVETLLSSKVMTVRKTIAIRTCVVNRMGIVSLYDDLQSFCVSLIVAFTATPNFLLCRLIIELNDNVIQGVNLYFDTVAP